MFAHYFPPYPVSIDNQTWTSDYYARNYLNPLGEGGKHAAFGGLLRDRPVGVAPGGSDYKLANLRTEVRQAKAAGIDGFTLNIMGASGSNWDAGVNLMKAARDVGDFTVVPNVDANGALATLTPDAAAAKLAELYAYSSAERVDGEYLLSSFYAEKKGAAWWDQTITSLETTHKVPVKFMAVFLNSSDTNMKAFAPFSHGFSNWGVRSARSVNNMPNFAAKAHALGRTWMEPVAFQDARPKSLNFAEASNTETGRATWSKAIRDGADFVQMVTWNDYSESSSIAPSMAHGSVFLDISSYYASWFKRGAAPATTEDHVYVTHRIHRSSVLGTTLGIQAWANTLGGSTTSTRNTVEGLVFLKQPATLRLTSGGNGDSFSLPAGTSAVTIPLQDGGVRATLVRDGATVMDLTSTRDVTPLPLVQDFQYWAFGR